MADVGLAKRGPAKKGDMGKLLDGLTWLLGALLRLALWVLLLGFGLLLLVVALPLLLLGALWALLRGRRVAVPLAAELLRRRAQQHMRGRGWGGGSGRGGASKGRADEVVDVEAREVSDAAPRPDQTPPPR